MNDYFKNTFLFNGDLSINDKVVMLGSCFSDNISELLLQDKIQVSANPFGTIFHPLAIIRLINRSINKEYFKDEDFFKHDNYWYCYEQHGSLAQRTLKEALADSNNKLDDLRNNLQKTNCLFLTFGSAWGYHLNENVVANCHLQPANLFSKKLSSVGDLQIELQTAFQKLLDINPELKIYLTVSPVRHYKDGVIENQRSKSVLILLVHELVEKMSSVKYFPAYEYIIDELRDYSFFKDDKVHPNKKAIGLLYDGFKTSFFNEETLALFQEWGKIKHSLNHRSLHPFSAGNLKFKLALLDQLQKFKKKYGLDLSVEIRTLALEIEILNAEI